MRGGNALKTRPICVKRDLDATVDAGDPIKAIFKGVGVYDHAIFQRILSILRKGS